MNEKKEFAPREGDSAIAPSGELLRTPFIFPEECNDEFVFRVRPVKNGFILTYLGEEYICTDISYVKMKVGAFLKGPKPERISTLTPRDKSKLS